MADIVRVHGTERPDHTSLIEGTQRLTWADLYGRAQRVANGFAAAPDAPLYVITASEKLQLRAIDVQQKRNTPLFAHELDQLADRIWLCGRTLIVCDSQQVEAIDYRTGETRWKSPRDGFYECYGVIQGVLLVTRQSQGAEGEDKSTPARAAAAESAGMAGALSRT